MKYSPWFDSTIAATDYAPPIDQMVLALKFGGRLALARLFAERIHESAKKYPNELPQLLTAVPLGPKRLAERGFNQALEIARPLARQLNIPLDFKLVTRTRETATQSLLPPDERRRNIRHAFEVPAAVASRLQGLHIGIVDDVMTTGETLNELAALLKRLGASRITNFVFARTPK
jgi:ComF family protein